MDSKQKDELKTRILSALEDGIQRNVKLYLCAMGGLSREVMDPEVIAREVSPRCILLDMNCPADTYQNGVLEGLFKREFSETISDLALNSRLKRIKRVADYLNCPVAGIDVSPKKNKELLKKHKIKYSRVWRIRESLADRADNILYGSKVKLSDKEYEQLGKFFDIITSEPGRYENPADEVHVHLSSLKSAIDKFLPLHKHFPKSVLPALKNITEDFTAYRKEADELLYKNFKSHYTGDKTVLCLLSPWRIGGDAHFTQLLKKDNIPYAAFSNIDPKN